MSSPRDRLHLASLAFLLSGLASLALVAPACGPTYPSCENDGHCAAKNEVCVDRKCRQCRDDSQCTRLDPCMMCGADNSCALRQGCCKTDLDCPGGKCWRTDDSEVGTCGGGCRSSEQCPPGQQCVGGSCVPTANCTDDSSCGPGQKCVDGDCRTTSCELRPTYFDFNEYVVRLDMESVIAENAACLSQMGLPHRLEGHCDERGSDEYNLALGQRRAGAVYRQYRDLGVNPALLSTISYGEERPVCHEHDASCWDQNRRVETARQR